MGGISKAHYQYDASSMDPEKLHAEATSSTMEQYTKYSREANIWCTARIPTRIPSRSEMPRLLAFDETSSSEGTLYI